jgi:serine/threonine protein kinase
MLRANDILTIGHFFVIKDPTQVEGYLNEIDVLKRLSSSPHIIKLIDAEVNQMESCIHMVRCSHFNFRFGTN